MSTPDAMASFLARLAPQLDAHQLLKLTDFYGSNGVDVAAAQEAITAKTKLNPTDDVARQLSDAFKKALDVATPLIKQYFELTVTGEHEEYVLKVPHAELVAKKASSEELMIRTFDGQTKETTPVTRNNKETAKAFKERMAEKFGVSGDTRRVDIVEDTSADLSGRRAGDATSYIVVVTEARGQIDEKQFDAMLKVASLLYETGRYREASEFLVFARYVLDESSDKTPSALWGLLASSIMAQQWGQAESALESLRTVVTREIGDEEFKVGNNDDISSTTRNWMLHWSLFVFFKGGESLTSQFLDIVFDTNVRFNNRKLYNQHTIETAAPHLLRYVAAACLLNRTKRSALYSTLRLIRVCFEYSDDLTTFMDLLLGSVNFDEAFALIPAIEALVQKDYFLCGLRTQIVDGAYKLIYEQYLRTHKAVSIESIAKKLFAGANLESAQAKAKAELWIANLIREAKIEAKIDSVAGKVDVSSSCVSIHQRIYEKLSQMHRPQLS